ncbi:MAG: ribosome silencing factor [Deltaproteobacteria bacterium]|nr:ribosome silencing factor [Deltaproteobacteria bacterium]
MDSKEKALYIASLAAERKALGIIILDVKGLSSIADYIVICHGTSDRQVQAIAEFVEQGLKKKRLVPIGTEGIASGRWALLDYGDIILHIFFEPVRDFYDLEGLWAEAPQLYITT